MASPGGALFTRVAYCLWPSHDGMEQERGQARDGPRSPLRDQGGAPRAARHSGAFGRVKRVWVLWCKSGACGVSLRRTPLPKTAGSNARVRCSTCCTLPIPGGLHGGWSHGGGRGPGGTCDRPSLDTLGRGFRSRCCISAALACGGRGHGHSCGRGRGYNQLHTRENTLFAQNEYTICAICAIYVKYYEPRCMFT